MTDKNFISIASCGFKNHPSATGAELTALGGAMEGYYKIEIFNTHPRTDNRAASCPLSNLKHWMEKQFHERNQGIRLFTSMQLNQTSSSMIFCHWKDCNIVRTCVDPIPIKIEKEELEAYLQLTKKAYDYPREQPKTRIRKAKAANLNPEQELSQALWTARFG